MLSSLPFTSDRTATVAQLSDEYQVDRVDEHWLITGPTGVFVVGQSGFDAHQSARRVVDLSRRLHSQLALHMAWVPFVDALLVGPCSTGDLSCSVVDPAMLESVLVDGHTRLDPATLGEVRHHLTMMRFDHNFG